MFQLDDKFLADIGLNDLPEEQKKAFLQHIYDELELRVGTKLSDGMTDAQLEEFESIIDRKNDIVTAWLAQHAPDYQNDEVFKRIQQAAAQDADDALPVDELALRSEYAASKWLEINRPDYRNVVASVLDDLKNEIASNRDKILGTDQPAA
jgi:hypothetical protein